MIADVLPQEYDAFDQLATMVAIARSEIAAPLAESVRRAHGDTLLR